MVAHVRSRHWIPAERGQISFTWDIMRGRQKGCPKAYKHDPITGQEIEPPQENTTVPTEPKRKKLEDGKQMASVNGKGSASLRSLGFPLPYPSLKHILSYILYHGPQKWTPREHFHDCGQSCGCCRSRAKEVLGCCEVCEDGWTLSCVSQLVLQEVREYAAQHTEVYMHCECGQCHGEWLDRGWVCPLLICWFYD